MKLELLIKIMRISDKSIYIKFLTQKHKGGSVQCEMTKKTPSQNQQTGGEGQDWGPRWELILEGVALLPENKLIRVHGEKPFALDEEEIETNLYFKFADNLYFVTIFLCFIANFGEQLLSVKLFVMEAFGFFMKRI